MLRVDVLTLFPDMFESVLNQSILKRAREAKKINVVLTDLREYTSDRHRTCDDRPFGGGPGMVMKAEPIDKALKKIHKGKKRGDIPVIYLSPQGSVFSQNKAQQLSSEKRLILLCGHYEGIDQRVIDKWVTEEISIGDYILTGGELPALVILDSVCRLIPEVLGNQNSAAEETFSHDLLEYPQYTRPAEFEGESVPEILLSGDHQKIEAWRLQQAVRRTKQRRPDLYKKYCKNAVKGK